MTAHPPSLRRLILSIIVISGLASKLLHLHQHWTVLFGYEAVYFPTLFIQETLLFVGVWLLLFKTAGLVSALGLIISLFLAMLDLVAAASQFSFFYKTGGEIRWDAARSVASNESGLKLILSGLIPTLTFTGILFAISWFSSPLVHLVMSRWLCSLPGLSGHKTSSKETLLPSSENGSTGASKPRRGLTPAGPTFWTLFIALSTVALWIIRPSVPYTHMSQALPFAMFGSHQETTKVVQGGWPYPETAVMRFWEEPKGAYKGWKPDLDFPKASYPGDDLDLPWWAVNLPAGFERWKPRPVGNDTSANTTETDSSSSDKEKGKDDKKKEKGEGLYFYDPVTDPMRISNLHLDPLQPLKDAMKERDIPIKHIVYIFLESGRDDLFPLTKDSHLHKEILKSHDFKTEKDEEELQDLLASLTPVAEKLTGVSSGFDKSRTDHKDVVLDTEMGGLSYDGIITGSTLSAKSRLVNYCGTNPLPVDFMFENGVMPYQPCLMHIMDLFNQRKNLTEDGQTKRSFWGKVDGDKKDDDKNDGDDENKEDKVPVPDDLEQEWETIYAQSITGKFQKQFELMENMGFQTSLYSEHIEKRNAKYWHSGMEKVNYFGFPETEIKPYLKDMIDLTVKNNKRLFLSHFTSSTHHPWATPKSFKRHQYFGSETGKGKRDLENDIHEHEEEEVHELEKRASKSKVANMHEDMNNYLNAIRFVDDWVGQMMEMIEEAGIANQTLTVFVGDHGQAFREDTAMTGTYDNPHISNFRVPLLFHHPLLPRMHIASNATTLSIIPTILDLLVSTNSLNEKDSQIATDMMNKYEGQSLLRPYIPQINGREAWNFGVINAGGTQLSVGSAAVPYRLIVPLNPDMEFRFTSLETDPYELKPMVDWSLESLMWQVKAAEGQEAADWLIRANRVAEWWVRRQKLLWEFDGSTK